MSISDRITYERPILPPADPWDRQTGIKPVASFKVDCVWTPLDEDWAYVSVLIRLHNGTFALLKDAEIKRVYREMRTGRVESPELTALAWSKKAVSSGGVPVLSVNERDPGHNRNPNGSALFRWQVEVGSRLSVAIIKLDGDLEGQVRLVRVD